MFVCLLFMHLDTIRPNAEILQATPFRSGEGRRVVFDRKFSPHGVFATSIVGLL
jgi:hypothetical protein